MTFKDFKERYSSSERAKQENSTAVLMTSPADRGDRHRRVHSHRAAGDPRHWHHRRFRVLDPGQGRGRSGAALRAHPGIPRRCAQASRAGGLELHPRQLAAAWATVDRSKVLLGVPWATFAAQAQFGSIVVSQFTQYSRVWNVILQADAPYRQTPNDISKLYTKSTNGKMVPLSAVVSTEYVVGPDLVPHFNGFPAAQVTGGAAPGYSSGDAIKAMQETAAKALPDGYGSAWSERSPGTSPAKLGAAFAFCILIVFLIRRHVRIVVAAGFGAGGCAPASSVRWPLRRAASKTTSPRSACSCSSDWLPRTRSRSSSSR
jgi:multidrug efflux pump